MDARASFLDQLFAAGVLIDTGVDGLPGRSGGFEDVVAAFDRRVSACGESDGAETLRFPPGMNRRDFEHSGYLKSFPQLAGAVTSFCGGEHDHVGLLSDLAEGRDWTARTTATEVVLAPAACYPLYPTLSRRGPLPVGGGVYDLQSYCFRHEPSRDPARMQMFRMREYVRAGSAAEVLAFRETWLERGRALIGSLDLEFEVDVAHDPFFGRGGRMLGANQREQGLKFELLVPVANAERPTACLSFNYHQDHFGSTWGLKTAEGATAHTACVGFGLERVALALYRRHGLEVRDWPEAVRSALWD